mgnify:CR=1 FL=1
MSNNDYKFEPDWSHFIAPGESILEAINDKNLSKKTFAEYMDYSYKHIYKLIEGQASITEDTALRLEKVLNIPAKFWMNLESTYRGALAKKQEAEILSQNNKWLEEIPLKDMIKLNWIEKYADKGLQIIECLKFYGVASIEAWHKQEQDYKVAFKAYDKCNMNEVAIQTWLKRGEIEASAIHCNPFNKKKLIAYFGELRALTLIKDPKVFLPKLKTICADCGVAVVLIQTPSQCPMGGATKWLSSNKALLMLSARGKNEGSLWFSFFHELGHILNHNKKALFLEGNKKDFCNHSTLEYEADNFASNILIPAKYINEMKYLKNKMEIIKFADKIGISSGVVVGRMQHEKIIPYSYHKDLQVSYKFS